MAERTIKTRIKLLFKSYSEWELIKSTFIPLAGEVCIVNVPASSGAVAQEPAVLFKVGDGINAFADLPYASALAADVYSWAKKSSLDWADLDASFKAELEEFIQSKSKNIIYRLNSTVPYIWKLQKSEDDGETWSDVEGSNIDVTALEESVADLEEEILKKVDRSIVTESGTSLIFNEADGGGAKFENADGTWSFVGVNDGGADGIAAQIYAVDAVSKQGTRINVTKDGIYYTSGATSAAYTADDELVTKKDIKGIEGALHYIGKTTMAAGETIAQAIERLLAEKSHTAIAGDVVIITTTESNREFIYNGSSWEEFGDEGLYATKAALAAEEAARTAADTALAADIAKKTDKIIEGSNGRALIFNEHDGGGAKFEHNDGSESFVGVNDGGLDGMMAQIYADKMEGGNWAGSRLNVYNERMYYINKEDKKAGTLNNDAGHEIAIKKDLVSKIDEEDLLILDCNFDA